MSDTTISRVRWLLGGIFYVGMIIPFILCIIAEELSVRLQAACEATIGVIWDCENWRDIYKRDIENRGHL